MKILAVFVDMLGADYLNVANPNAAQTDIDRMLLDIGGTFYTNCYTPAPDTPRSFACMWTGLYPKANGCDNRLKYPGKFLKTQKHVWNTLKNKEYQLNIFIKEAERIIGTLPSPFEKYTKGMYFDDFLNQLNIKENSFTFLHFEDLHSILDNYGYTKRSLNKGATFVANMMQSFFQKYDADFFDYIIFFSDHGFRYECEKREYLLDTDRIRTSMFIRKKGDNSLKTDSKLCSNLDLFPTVCEMVGEVIPKEIDGKSLLSDEHEYVLLEDHQNFSVELGQTIELWGVVLKDGIYRLECSGEWSENAKQNPDFECNSWKKIIENKMDNYEENHKLWQARHIYDGNKINSRIYSDGSPMKKGIGTTKCMIYAKLIIRKIRYLAKTKR